MNRLDFVWPCLDVFFLFGIRTQHPKRPFETVRYERFVANRDLAAYVAKHGTRRELWQINHNRGSGLAVVVDRV